MDLTFLLPTPPSPGTFSKNYKYSKDYVSDRNHVVDIAKRANKNQCRIHQLVDEEGTHYGFIALSIAVLSNKPCLVIDYLFVSDEYRGATYEELDNLTLGQFLLTYAYQLAVESDKNYPIRYIALEPANEKLKKYYSSTGYVKIDGSNFMYLKISATNS